MLVGSERFRRAFTLIELLVVVAIISLLISILLPGLQSAREQAKLAVCGSNLRGVGQSVAMCQQENREFGPSWDDGEAIASSTPKPIMYTWVDVLYDTGYLGDTAAGLCPSDQRPDDITLARTDAIFGDGVDWPFYRVDHPGTGEQPKPGPRTSFAINAVAHGNFKEDRYTDTTRQVFAMDGFWSWFGLVESVYLDRAEYGFKLSSQVFPSQYKTMAGFRHQKLKKGNGLFFDGHVDGLQRRKPDGPQQVTLRSGFDTVRAFAWRPGEYTGLREYFDAYDGLADDFKGQKSMFARARAGEVACKAISAGDNKHPPSYPEVLSAYYRTTNNLWKKLVSNPKKRAN